MAPGVAGLVGTFLAVTGACVLPCIIRECWPVVPEEIPQQDLNRVCMSIVEHLDGMATCGLSLMAWDMFVFPKAEEEHWWEDCLSYYLGKLVKIGARMPGIWLVMQDAVGQYSSNACILLYEGQMLGYDPASNLTEWVPMQGMSSSLMSTELKSTNDLSNIFPCPHPKVAPPRMQSPRPIHG